MDAERPTEGGPPKTSYSTPATTATTRTSAWGRIPISTARAAGR